MFKFPKLNIPKQLFASNPFQRPNPTQPAPQPVRPPFTSAFGQPFARAPQPVQGPSAFAGMFGNGGFGQPISPIPQQPTQSPFLGGFGGGQIIPIQQTPQPPMGVSGLNMFRGFGGGQPMPAQQTPQPTTGLSGLGTLSPEQINQLRNSIQTLPANINQELAKMSPEYSNTNTQNTMANPNAPTSGLSSLGLS